jgi:hypothetical protein
LSKIEVNTIEPQCGTTLTVGAVGTTVTVPSNVVKSNALQAADAGNIISQSGTAITLGASGDSINLASGATQSGFGRTGTVDWDTTAKTTTVTAANGVGYFVNTTAGAITVTLPTSPSAGDIVAVADYAGTAATNNITIGRNGSNIEGGTTDGTISTNRETKTLVYVDGTQGWIPVNDNFDSIITPEFVAATGGTETTSPCGDYKIHTFTGPGTFCVSNAGNGAGSNTTDYMVIAGGGGGGDGRGGGGGAGGYRFSNGTASGCYSAGPAPLGASALPVSVQGYPITIGSGGAGAISNDTNGLPGANSIFSSITSTGGGGGGAVSPCGPSGDLVKQGRPGGSGGGAGGTFCAAQSQPGGSGNTPPVSPPQGNPGGNGVNNGPPTVPATSSHGAGGGGAGAAAVPVTGTPSTSNGGNGLDSSITATPITRGGGGGSASDAGATSGGSGGGGDGRTTNSPLKNGTTNTGGGGGGVAVTVDGGSGGSGIVIIRYKFQ